MRDKREFQTVLAGMDGQNQSTFSQLEGDFDFSRFVLHVLRVEKSTDGLPTAICVVHVPQMIAGFPSTLFNTPIRRTALEDYLARKVCAAIDEKSLRSVRARYVAIARPGAEVLPRSSMIVAQDFVETRLSVTLPLQNDLVDSRATEEIFFEDFPALVNTALLYCYHDEEEITKYIQTMEDADAIRQALPKKGLAGFIGEGSRLPGSVRRAIAVEEASALTLDTPNSKSVRGIGIPAGVTLIVGDPYSGRRELVSAIERGIYNHIPGDGRELIVTVPDAVAIEAESGRSVQRVDISLFIPELPGCNTTAFSTASATSSESQMASMMEAVQAGAQVLIVDEDASDPSFLAADVNLLAGPAGHPKISPLASRARQIADQWRVSIVVGACACADAFIPAADAIFIIENGRLRNITKEAKASFGSKNLVRSDLRPLPAPGPQNRVIIPSSIDPSLGHEDAVIQSHGMESLTFGRSKITLSAIPQIAEEAQVNTIGLLINFAKLRYLDEPQSLTEVLDQIDTDLASEGLDAVTRELRGDLARPRRFEIAAALNRLRTLRLRTPAAR